MSKVEGWSGEEMRLGERIAYGRLSHLAHSLKRRHLGEPWVSINGRKLPTSCYFILTSPHAIYKCMNSFLLNRSLASITPTSLARAETTRLLHAIQPEPRIQFLGNEALPEDLNAATQLVHDVDN